MHYIVANLKQHLSLAEVPSYLDKFFATATLTEEKQLIFAPPFTLLSQFAAHPQSPRFSLSGQTASPFADGAYTGQVGAGQLAGLVKYSIIGHSETRKLYNVSDKEIARAAAQLLKHNITPIVCLDTPYLVSQIAILKSELLDLKPLLFAYEPSRNIGTGQPQSPGLANTIAFKIKQTTARSIPVLYGGSVDQDNVNSFTKEEYLDGVLVGTACVDPRQFASLYNSV